MEGVHASLDIRLSTTISCPVGKDLHFKNKIYLIAYGKNNSGTLGTGNNNKNKTRFLSGGWEGAEGVISEALRREPRRSTAEANNLNIVSLHPGADSKAALCNPATAGNKNEVVS